MSTDKHSISFKASTIIDVNAYYTFVVCYYSLKHIYSLLPLQTLQVWWFHATLVLFSVFCSFQFFTSWLYGMVMSGSMFVFATDSQTPRSSPNKLWQQSLRIYDLLLHSLQLTVFNSAIQKMFFQQPFPLGLGRFRHFQQPFP